MLFPLSMRGKERDKESMIKKEIGRYQKLSTSKDYFSIPSALT